MTESKATVDPILITFPPSLDSELARFLVEHYGIQCRENPHVIVFSFFYTLWHGTTVIFPLLYGKSFRLAGPRAIADYFDARCAPALRLWPQAQDQRSQAETDWNLFNGTLAFATAVFAYYHLLPHRNLMIGPLSRGAPEFEQKSVERAYPFFADVLRLLLRLTSQRAHQSLDQIRTIFHAVDARIAGGQKYLVGGALTLSDLAFSVAAAPVVLPPSYGGPIPAFADMPPEIQAAVTELRAHPAGGFALRIYEEQRHRFGAA
jgi:glutathione S-transferase